MSTECSIFLPLGVSKKSNKRLISTKSPHLMVTQQILPFVDPDNVFFTRIFADVTDDIISKWLNCLSHFRPRVKEINEI